MRKNEKNLGAKWSRFLPRHLKCFVKSEDGTMVVFGLVVFVMMLMAGGVAIDFMRFEYDRAKLQYSLDRALLAAGSLNQELDPEDVVRDYLAKADLGDHNLDVLPGVGTNFKIVNASASTQMNTFFINMLGIEEMTASASGTAAERRQKVEISLVLDVSGSMGNNGKLDNLKVAAKDFIDTILTEDKRDLVSISIIPYNMQVNAGADILDQMNVTDEHAYSNCVDFSDNDFATVALDSSTIYQRTGHFDPFFTDWTDHENTDFDDNLRNRFMCPTTTWSEISLHSQDVAGLKARIDALQHGGNTSIDIGVRWGATFLDPSSQAIVAANDNVPDVFKERPLAYDPGELGEVKKILIVMTDGKNTTQYALNEDFKDGPSNIWKDPDSTYFGIRNDEGTGPDADGSGHRDNAEFFNTDLYEFDLDGDGVEDKYLGSDPHNVANAERLEWPEVWAQMSVRYNAFYHHFLQNEVAADYFDWIDPVMTGYGTTEKNTRLQTSCTAAKTQGIEIYTIGFEVSTTSGEVMRQCATSDANYFAVAGEEISDAFNSIAKTIQRLRLIN